MATLRLSTALLVGVSYLISKLKLQKEKKVIFFFDTERTENYVRYFIREIEINIMHLPYASASVSRKSVEKNESNDEEMMKATHIIFVVIFFEKGRRVYFHHFIFYFGVHNRSIGYPVLLRRSYEKWICFRFLSFSSCCCCSFFLGGTIFGQTWSWRLYIVLQN